jgi:hypothetical protein
MSQELLDIIHYGYTEYSNRRGVDNREVATMVRELEKKNRSDGKQLLQR